MCHACGSTFTTGRRRSRPGARFDDEVAGEAVRLYVQGLSSYRTLAVLMERRLGRPVGRFTLNGWVDDFGARAATPLELSTRLAPTWGGVLGVDGKAIWIAGREACLLLAVDQATQDVVHALVVASEDEDSFERLVRESVTVAGYPLRGLVMDAAAAFLAGHANYFARLPLQLCRVHASRRLDQYLRKYGPNAALNSELKSRLRSVLFAPSEESAADALAALGADRDRYAGLSKVDTIGGLQRQFRFYTTHYGEPDMPADANITENVIKQHNKKLRLMEGFATLESAERFSRLLTGCYRFKRFTDSCRAGGNGKSPLELAGVDTAGTDWLTCLLQR